jgi:protein transport protein SEC24
VSEGVDSPGQADQRQPSTSPGTSNASKAWPSNSAVQATQAEPKQKPGLDLDFVPRPNVVSGENTVKGVVCNAKAQVTNMVPCPAATTRHYTPDEGNSIYRLFRVTSQCILMDGSSFFNTSNLPFGAIAQPFADLSEYEAAVPLSKYGGAELIRCNRCGAYINPGFAFMHSGIEFRCNICEGISQSSVPVFGANEGRPELTLGTYDFNAPEVLKGKPIKGNNLLLVIEATQNSINFGNSK